VAAAAAAAAAATATATTEALPFFLNILGERHVRATRQPFRLLRRAAAGVEADRKLTSSLCVCVPVCVCVCVGGWVRVSVCVCVFVGKETCMHARGHIYVGMYVACHESALTFPCVIVREIQMVG